MNKQYTAEDRMKYLAAWRESGISGGQFCRENDIRPTTFYNWTQKERQKQNKESGIVKLTSLQINMSGMNNIILENRGWKIILAPGFRKAGAMTAMILMEEKSVC